MQKRGFHPTFGRRRTLCRREKKNQESPLKSMAATENIPLPHNGDHLTSALSLQQDSVRLRRCGSRRHLRGRIALQANLFFAISYPRALPGVSHGIAFQAKILLLSIALLQTTFTSTEKGFCLSFKAARAGGALCLDEDGLRAQRARNPGQARLSSLEGCTPAKVAAEP